MAITLSHGGPSVYTSSAPAAEVLVGTKEGVIILERSVDTTWRVAHHALKGSHIHALLVAADNGLIFAGVSHGGVYVSSNDGQAWERRDDGITCEDIYSLACAQIDGRTHLFVGTEPAHLFQSDDLGKSWSELPGLRSVPSVEEWTFPGPPHFAHLKHINFRPDDPATMFASIERRLAAGHRRRGGRWRWAHRPLYEGGEVPFTSQGAPTISSVPSSSRRGRGRAPLLCAGTHYCVPARRASYPRRYTASNRLDYASTQRESY